MAWLLYGQLNTGELIHISEAARGEACGCACPHCGTPVAARKGKIKVHHFAHLGPTCAYLSVYDFLHIDNSVDTTLSLFDWATWKQNDIQKTRIQLQTENEQHGGALKNLVELIDDAREELAIISEPHPNRKQRSKVRQANYEVLQQWDAYRADHNAPIPALKRVRDPESTPYSWLYWRNGRYDVIGTVWPNELWYEENKQKALTPSWLTAGALALLNDYRPLRRKALTAGQHWEAFQAERVRFSRFRLYFLLVELANRPPLFKIGITSRPDLSERIQKIKADLQRYDPINVSVLVESPGYAFLESYFKHKYASQQTKLDKLTEYFRFDDEQLATILHDLHRLSPVIESKQSLRESIRAGMTQTRRQGVHVGRPAGKEADTGFLRKPKSVEVARLMEEHPDWSLREVARQSGIALNTVCKVARLRNSPPAEV